MSELKINDDAARYHADHAGIAQDRFHEIISLLLASKKPDEFRRAARAMHYLSGCLNNLAEQVDQANEQEAEQKRRDRNRRARERRAKKIADTPFSQLIQQKLGA